MLDAYPRHSSNFGAESTDGSGAGTCIVRAGSSRGRACACAERQGFRCDGVSAHAAWQGACVVSTLSKGCPQQNLHVACPDCTFTTSMSKTIFHHKYQHLFTTLTCTNMFPWHGYVWLLCLARQSPYIACVKAWWRPYMHTPTSFALFPPCFVALKSCVLHHLIRNQVWYSTPFRIF